MWTDLHSEHSRTCIHCAQTLPVSGAINYSNHSRGSLHDVSHGPLHNSHRIHPFTHIYMYTHACMHTLMGCIHLHTHTHTHIHTLTQTHTHSHTHTHTENCSWTTQRTRMHSSRMRTDRQLAVSSGASNPPPARPDTHPPPQPRPSPLWTDRCLWKHYLLRFPTLCGR